jgi:allantoate deiminase
MNWQACAEEVLRRCAVLAQFSEEPGRLTRRFLSRAYADVVAQIRAWAEAARMEVTVDGIGNVLATYPGRRPGAPFLVIGSHLDTVPDAGRYDGALGVVLGLTLVEALAGHRLSYGIQVVGFSDEEGVRYGIPFLGSRGYVGQFEPAWLEVRDHEGTTLREALRHFGLDPERAAQNCSLPERALGYLEFHIEQGPVLEEAGVPVGIVTGIVGMTRASVTFHGIAAHAGTTPMGARRDALAGAASFIVAVERLARSIPGLVATVGQVDVQPGATNVVPGTVGLSLDVRHADDRVRQAAVQRLHRQAARVAAVRKLAVEWSISDDRQAIQFDNWLRDLLEVTLWESGHPVVHLTSGAGHDAMVLAQHLPSALLFLRCAGGISHHPAERVDVDDVAVALAAGHAFLQRLDQWLGREPNRLKDRTRWKM